MCVCVCVCVKCLDERSKPVQEQQGSLRCLTCKKWFRSAGGLSTRRGFTVKAATELVPPKGGPRDPHE